MKEVSKKVIKGFTALFLIQLIAFLTVFAFQSCKKSDIEGDRVLQKSEVAKLNTLIKEKTPTLLSINAVKKGKLSDITLMSKGQTTVMGTNGENITITPEYQLQCENEIRPIYNQSSAVISAYGISEQDLIYEWGLNYDPVLVVELALSICAYEALDNEYNIASVRQSIFLIAPSYANKLYDCVKTALGIEALYELWRQRALSSYAGKKLLIKAIGKVATRSLGWVGAAWAVADFVDCYW